MITAPVLRASLMAMNRRRPEGVQEAGLARRAEPGPVQPKHQRARNRLPTRPNVAAAAPLRGETGGWHMRGEREDAPSAKLA